MITKPDPKPKAPPTEAISFRVEVEKLKEFDQLCKIIGVDRSEALRQLLNKALEGVNK